MVRTFVSYAAAKPSSDWNDTDFDRASLKLEEMSGTSLRAIDYIRFVKNIQMLKL